jgi:hypothetical protein
MLRLGLERCLGMSPVCGICIGMCVYVCIHVSGVLSVLAQNWT